MPHTPEHVWVIEIQSQYDGWNGLTTSEYIDPDHGFFLTEEDAEAKCAALLEAIRRPAYDSYVQKTEGKNRRAALAYEDRKLDYEALRAAGRPATKPKSPVPEKVRTFEEWVKDTYRWHYTIYRPVMLTAGRK